MEPRFAFSLDERFHINIIKGQLDRLELTPGPWLNRFKALLYQGAADLKRPVKFRRRQNSGGKENLPWEN
jgi:hypothetical protein